MFTSPTIFLDVDELITQLRYVLSKHCLAGLGRADHEQVVVSRCRQPPAGDSLIKPASCAVVVGRG
jgi:hypothetical protein